MTWTTQPIGWFCSKVTSGGTPSTKRDEYYGGAIPWLRTQEVTFEPIWDTEIKITEAGLRESAAKLIPENSVIVAMYGASAGRVAINRIPLATNQACCNLVVDENIADFRFVYYALRHQFVALEGLAKGAAQRNLNAGQIRSFRIPAPSLSEQHRIASTLSAYDDLIENNRQRIRLLEQAACLLYKEWFVHLRFPSHEHVRIIGGVPQGWSEGVLSDFYTTASGGTPGRKNADFYTGNIPWVKTKELRGGFILSTEERITEEAVKQSSAKVFPRHTVLVAMYGATIGQHAIVSMPAASNQACCAINAKEPGTSFTHAYLFLSHHKADLMSLGQGAAQKNISQAVICSFKMVLPHPRLLALFSQAVNPVFSQIETLQKTNIKLTKARDLQLTRLMNGEIIV